jgi:hypothetical protein
LHAINNNHMPITSITLTTKQLQLLKTIAGDYLKLLEETMGAGYYSSAWVAKVDDMLKVLEGQTE